MKQRLKAVLIKSIEGLTGKKVVFANNTARPTASLSNLGFWYAGNVFDTADIAHGISQNGIVEADETGLVISVLDSIVENKGSLSLYDIGANTGYYGILAGSRYGTKARVNSFEPISTHTESLKQSVYLNRLENVVTIHQLALGNKNSEETIYVAGSGTSLSKDFIQGQHRSTETVGVRKLDDLISSSTVKDLPDFIKIDVEGYEKDVLEGSREMLSSHQPILYIEIAKTLKNLGRSGFTNAAYQETFDLLAGIGYEAFVQENDKVVKFDSSSSTDGVRMYLFLHKDKHDFVKKALNI